VAGRLDPVFAGFDETAFEASHVPETTRPPLIVVCAKALTAIAR
jgi:hypothetical protein